MPGEKVERLNMHVYKHMAMSICIRHKKSRFGNTMETFEKIGFVGTIALFSRLKKFPWCSLKNTIFEVHKELSKSYREGAAQKLKSMVLPNKNKGLAKKLIELLC